MPTPLTGHMNQNVPPPPRKKKHAMSASVLGSMLQKGTQQQNFLLDLTQAFRTCNIPLNKLGHEVLKAFYPEPLLDYPLVHPSHYRGTWRPNVANAKRAQLGDLIRKRAFSWMKQMTLGHRRAGGVPMVREHRVVLLPKVLTHFGAFWGLFLAPVFGFLFPGTPQFGHPGNNGSLMAAKLSNAVRLSCRQCPLPSPSWVHFTYPVPLCSYHLLCASPATFLHRNVIDVQKGAYRCWCHRWTQVPCG